MDRNSHSPSICQKLINLFLLKLRPPPPARPASPGIPIKAGPSMAELDAEIAVDFRHKRDGLIGSDQAELRNGSAGRRARPGGGKGPKKTVRIEGSDHQEILVHDHRCDDHEMTKQRPGPRQHWPLLSVASNIDKKSDEFIESRRRAMGRNYSLDPKS